MLEQMGFSPARLVRGRASIADLFKPNERCGIYVLHFSNGEFYAGQAVDVTRRYVQHRKTHPDIEKIAFKVVAKHLLNGEERAVIGRLEQRGWPLRNITFTSIPKGESDFDLIMARQDQEQWLHEHSFVDDSGERLVDPDMRRKYHASYQRFLQAPHATQVLDILHTYVRSGIPAIRRGEISFWACSCMPQRGVYARVNIYWQEVLMVYRVEDEVWCSFHLARSPLARVLSHPFVRLFKRFGKARHVHHRYAPGGVDQTCFKMPATAVKAFIANTDVLSAIRLFNLRLMQKGPCTYGRYHCMDLADHLIESSDVTTLTR